MSKNNNGWTPARRKKQAQLIKNWQPWLKSTGAKTQEGKQRSARNAYKAGYWLKERELRKQINQAIREQIQMIDWILP